MYVRTGNTSFSSSSPFQRIRLSLVKKSKCFSKVTGKRACRDAEISSANPVSRLQNIPRKNARARGQRKGLPSRLVKPFLKKEEKPIVCLQSSTPLLRLPVCWKCTLLISILGDPGAVSRVDKMFVVKVYWKIDLTVNFHLEHFIGSTNCPWVSEDDWYREKFAE